MNDEMNRENPPETGADSGMGSPGAPAASEDVKPWLIGLHLSPFAQFILPIPASNILAPLVIWLIKKEQLPQINEHGKAVLNFQITCAIAAFVCFLLSFVLIGIPMLFALVIYWAVMIIMGTIDASNGKLRTFPGALPLIK